MLTPALKDSNLAFAASGNFPPFEKMEFVL